MAWKNVRSVRLELAVCAVTPMAVLCAVAIPGYWHVSNMKAVTERQATVLAGLPVMEQRVQAAEALLKPYCLNGGRDRGGELTQGIRRAAEAADVTVKSVTAEKSVPVNQPACLDYQVKLVGEGSLGAVIRMTDTMDRSPAQIRTGSLRLRVKAFHPRTIYDVEWMFNSRSLTTGGVPAPGAGGVAALPRLKELTDAVAFVTRSDWPVPDTGPVDHRKSIVKEVPVKVVPDERPVFRLTGIVRDGRVPLAMTDRGVFGIGDQIDGYRLIKIEDDRVVVAGFQGRQEIVRLYKTEAKP